MPIRFCLAAIGGLGYLADKIGVESGWSVGGCGSGISCSTSQQRDTKERSKGEGALQQASDIPILSSDRALRKPAIHFNAAHAKSGK